MASQMATSRLCQAAGVRHVPCHATTHKTSCFSGSVTSRISRSIYISDVAYLRAPRATTSYVRCRSSSGVAVRSEISYVMIKPDGGFVRFQNETE